MRHEARQQNPMWHSRSRARLRHRLDLYALDADARSPLFKRADPFFLFSCFGLVARQPGHGGGGEGGGAGPFDPNRRSVAWEKMACGRSYPLQSYFCPPPENPACFLGGGAVSLWDKLRSCGWGGGWEGVDLLGSFHGPESVARGERLSWCILDDNTAQAMGAGPPFSSSS